MTQFSAIYAQKGVESSKTLKIPILYLLDVTTVPMWVQKGLAGYRKVGWVKGGVSLDFF